MGEDDVGEVKENDVKGSDLSKLAFVGILGFVMGASIIGLVMFDDTLPEPIVGGLLDEPEQLPCLTTADFNNDHLGAIVVMSRFCEGLGLRSSVYWQVDEQGNEFANPVCVVAQEGG